MKINVKTNLRQYLTEEIKPQNHSVKNIPKCRPRNYYINKNNNYIKNAKMMINNRKNNIIQNNITPKNNFINNYIGYKKPKTAEKINNNNNYLLIGYKENQIFNENRKTMIPFDIKKNLNSKIIPDYNSNSSFRKAIKYYTIKSNSKTIQVEDLSSYLRPMRNILRIKNNQKNKESQNTNNSNIPLNNTNYGNIINSGISNENNNRNNNYRTKRNYIPNIYINISENENQDINLMENFNNTNNNFNSSYLQNIYFNKNSLHTDRRDKFSKFPFNIKVNQVNKAIKIFNKNSKNITDSISINNNNSKNISDYETQISINNNTNNINKNYHLIENNSKTLYQFRPRKIHLPKSGINLSSMQYKNKILQNILNKRKKK